MQASGEWLSNNPQAHNSYTKEGNLFFKKSSQETRKEKSTNEKQCYFSPQQK